MTRSTQWLFEVLPPSSSLSTMPMQSIPTFEWESAPGPRSKPIVLKSPRFRDDQRLQAAANNRPAMRIGERGEAVKKIQQALIDLKFPMPISTRKRGTPDGIYGTETAAAVREFQRRHGLKQDGIAGQQTLTKLDELFNAPTSKVPPRQPPSDRQLIDQALRDSQTTIAEAISSLNSLELAVTSGLIRNPTVQAMHQRTLDAVRDRLKVSLSDSHFLVTIQRAKRKLTDNLNLQRRVGNLVIRNDAQCRTNEQNARYGRDSTWAWSDASSTIVCPKFITTCPECRRDVITHEFFHRIGLPGDGVATNTEAALNNANEMAQLVSHIVTGSTDACTKQDAGLPCGRPITPPPPRPQPPRPPTPSKTCNPFQTEFERAAVSAGVPLSWAIDPALCQLVKHESGWKPTAKNPTSSAFGLFQFLKSTWKKFLPEVPYGNTDSTWQAVGGFRYIKAAYRTPDRAWAFWQATVKKNAALAPSDLQAKARQWIAKGWGGY